MHAHVKAAYISHIELSSTREPHIITNTIKHGTAAWEIKSPESEEQVTQFNC